MAMMVKEELGRLRLKFFNQVRAEPGDAIRRAKRCHSTRYLPPAVS